MSPQQECGLYKNQIFKGDLDAGMFLYSPSFGGGKIGSQKNPFEA